MNRRNLTAFFCMVLLVSACTNRAGEAYEAALARLDQQDFAGAERLLDEAILANEGFADAYVARGTCRMNRGDFEGSLRDYSTAITITGPGKALPAVYFNRGVVLQSLSRYDSAIADFTMAVTIDPAFAKAYCRRALVLTSKNLIDSARFDLERAISIDPGLAEAYFALGNTYAEHDHPAAIEHYTKAIDLEANADYVFSRGLMHYQLANYTSAIADFSSALELDNRMVKAFEMRGNAYDESGSPELALKDFDQALLIDPGYASAYFNRGITRQNRGDASGACADFKKALELGHIEALTRITGCD